MSPVDTVQRIYEAFGRGDVPAILGHLAEDVLWEYDKQPAGVPWLLPRRGRAAVAGFFEALGALDFEQFQPRTLLASGNTVVALNDVVFTVKATGKRVAEVDEVHVWHFDGDGRVARFCHKTDSLAHWQALQPG